MKTYLKNILPAAAFLLAMGMTSCSSDLDVTPIDPNLQTGSKISSDNLLNKCYANLAVAGNGGANGDCDIDGLDGGTTGFVRQLFNAYELTTDEAVSAWGDAGVSNFNESNYDASHPMLKGFYYRLYAGIGYCNQYINEYGSIDAQKTAEARFLRAYQYSILMDGWGNVPFSTKVSSDKPAQIKRADLFKWIESELLDIESSLADAKPEKEGESGYGRVDKAADWLLLSRIYLNAEIYTGTARWADAATYSKKVIDSPFKLYTTAQNGWSAYQQLFMGDNGTNGASVESLFSIIQDGKKTTSWGTTLFLMAGSNNGKENIKDESTLSNGTTEGWAGNRAKKQLVEKFFPNDDAPSVSACKMPAIAGDDRALIQSKGRNLENTKEKEFTDGYTICKFNNFYATNGTANDTQFPDCDLFVLRAAEAYLTYAEATARQNGGVATADGITYLNQIRQRAHASQKAGYSLSDICDEWSREFYFEGRRRMDLIRFNRYAGDVNYNWAWKGGTLKGRNIDKHYSLFAIPTTDLNQNAVNLTQNPGY